jgi:hypothetical protein
MALSTQMKSQLIAHHKGDEKHFNAVTPQIADIEFRYLYITIFVIYR